VLISSHALAEVAQTVDDIVVINEGRCVAQAPLHDLAASYPGLTLEDIYLHLTGTSMETDPS
jgi:ABC-2 type transport system ATP-binding protein